MRTHKEAKAMAKSLRDSLAAQSVSLSHGQCLEIVAKQFGCANWNTLAAKLNAEPDRLALPEDTKSVLQPARTDEPEPLGCSFCGKSRHEVRSLCEGGCNRRGVSPCVFICDECVTLCAQANADALGAAPPV